MIMTILRYSFVDDKSSGVRVVWARRRQAAIGARRSLNLGPHVSSSVRKNSSQIS